MCYANNEKQKTTNDGRQKKKIRMFGGKETLKYFGILEEDTMKPAEIKPKNLKCVSHENEEGTRNQIK